MARSCFVIPALLASVLGGTSATAQTADRRPALEVIMDNRSPSAAPELAAARTHARFIFGEAGIRVTFVMQSDELATATSGIDRIHLVVLGQPEADRLIAGNVRRLGFAIPPAYRVYVHYDRVEAVARSRGVQPGWFLGVVMTHELAHVLLPHAGHSDAGLMAPSLSPDPKVPPAFTRQEARVLREQLRGETMLALR
jgi:hypothetical protein